MGSSGSSTAISGVLLVAGCCALAGRCWCTRVLLALGGGGLLTLGFCCKTGFVGSSCFWADSSSVADFVSEVGDWRSGMGSWVFSLGAPGFGGGGRFTLGFLAASKTGCVGVSWLVTGCSRGCSAACVPSFERAAELEPAGVSI